MQFSSFRIAHRGGLDWCQQGKSVACGSANTLMDGLWRGRPSPSGGWLRVLYIAAAKASGWLTFTVSMLCEKPWIFGVALYEAGKFSKSEKLKKSLVNGETDYYLEVQEPLENPSRHVVVVWEKF